MACHLKDKKGYLTLLGLIITLAIICFLFYTLINTYFKKLPVGKSLEGQGGILSGQGIDTTNYQSVTESTRKKVEDINKQHAEDLENIQKQLGR